MPFIVKKTIIFYFDVILMLSNLQQQIQIPVYTAIIVCVALSSQLILSLSRSRRNHLKHFEISVLRHFDFAFDDANGEEEGNGVGEYEKEYRWQTGIKKKLADIDWYKFPKSLAEQQVFRDFEEYYVRRGKT